MSIIRAVYILLALSYSAVAAKKNVLLICIDDLRPELNCYGVDYIKSPNIDSLASKGSLFLNHYVQAPTCGASRYALLTGRYGNNDNYALFERSKRIQAGEKVKPTMPAYFRSNGYTTVSIGKVSHHPGGRGGKNWDDESIPEMPNSWDKHLMPSGPWQHPRGVMHGLANGEIRVRAKDMAVYQAFDGPDTSYPDGLITNEAIQQLTELGTASKKGNEPFFLAVGLIRPHLPFGAPAKYLEPYKNIELPPIPHPEKPKGLSTWHQSWEFRKYKSWGKDARKDDEFATEVRKHYAACVTYADAQVGRILKKLDDLELADDTIIILWGDHGWHLGEHNIWGKHSLFEESLRAPLIFHVPGATQAGQTSSTIVETIDIFPTLCELTNIETPNHLNGSSLIPVMNKTEANEGSAISYGKNTQTIRTPNYRLIRHQQKGHAKAFELYDHQANDGETTNIADKHPELIAELEKRIDARLKK